MFLRQGITGKEESFLPSMKASQIFALLLAFGYVGARLLLGRVRITGRTRHFILLGGEYIALGALLGPRALGWINEGVVRDLEPVLAIGIGWLGVLYGLQFGRDYLSRFPLGSFAAAFGFPVGTALLMSFPVAAGLQLVGHTRGPVGIAALALVAAASCTSPMAIAIMSRGVRRMASVTYLLRIVSALDALPGILVLGLTYAFVQPVLPGAPGLLIGIGAPLLLGLFYHRFLGYLSSRDEILLVTIGVISFVGGSAFSTSMSPLFSSFLVGVLLANLPGARMMLLRLLSQTEKPFYIVFLLLAGTRWEFSVPSHWLFGLVYVGIRVLAKLTVPFVAAHFVRDREVFPPELGLGLLGQGGIAVAIALEFDLLFPSEIARAVLSAVVVSIFLHQVLAPMGLRLLYRNEEPVGAPRREVLV